MSEKDFERKKEREAEKRLKEQRERLKREEEEKRDEQEKREKEQEKERKAEKEREQKEKKEKDRMDKVASKGRPSQAVKQEAGPTLVYPRTGSPVPPTWKVLERYALYSGFVYATIAENPSGERKYFLDEVPLTESEAQVYTYLANSLENEFTVPRGLVNPKQYFEEQSKKLAAKYSIDLPPLPWAKILYFTERDVIGFKALDGFMRDPAIEDISVDGVNKPVFVFHNRYESLPTNLVFDTNDEITELAGRLAHIAGKHVSSAFPIVQGSLPGGHRMIATYMKEVSPQGGTINIRKFRTDPLTIIDLINSGTMDLNLAAFTWLAMENKAVAMAVGATGTGKTTLLNTLLTLTRANSKIITIEEVQELNLAHPNWTPLVAREGYGVSEEASGDVGLFELVKAAMRMRPDIIVVGEVRGEEAYVLFQAISTGHGGLCTLHSDDASSAVQRLTSKPMDVPPAFIPFVDLIYTIRRVALRTPGGETRFVRRIASVDEVRSVGDFNRLFTWDPKTDTQVMGDLKTSKLLQNLSLTLGLSVRQLQDEVERRAEVLHWMQREGVRNFKEITPTLEAYIRNPEETYQRVVSEMKALNKPNPGSRQELKS